VRKWKDTRKRYLPPLEGIELSENDVENRSVETKMGIKIDPFSHRLSVLENENAQLKQILMKIEVERKSIENDLLRLQSEINRYKNEVDRLKNPPLVIGFLRDFLPDGRVVVKSSAGPDFVVQVAGFVARHKLVPGCRVALDKDFLTVVNILPSSKDYMVSGAEIIEKPPIRYHHIGGLADQIRDIRETVELPLIKPELFKKIGIDPPKGVLLIGPPGTGKTLLAKAVAGETNATYIRLVGSELVQKFIGEGARLVRELFELAKEKVPSIIFIDELDAIGARRLETATSGDREVQRTLMQLLAELDGFESIGNISIIGATNRPDILDDALLRPGRFDRIIEIPMPNREARKEIFRIHTSGMNLAVDVNIDALVEKCSDTTGADVKAVCTEAGMFAIRDGRDTVTMKDFVDAVHKVVNTDALENAASEAMFG
jgi:proteasome regulatory subunit